MATTLLLLALTAAATLLVHRSVVTGRSGPDEGFHLHYARQIRRAGGRIPDRIRGFYFESPFDYPWLYHLGLSLLPEDWLRRRSHLPNLLVSVVTGVALFGVTWGVGRTWMPTDRAGWAGAAAVGLWLATPMTVNRRSGIGRLTPRPAGVLLSFLAIGLSAAGVGLGRPLLVSAAVLPAAAVFLTSKFAVQTLVLVLPTTALLTWEPLYAAVPVGGLAVATLLSAGRALEVVRGHLRHLRFYGQKIRGRAVGLEARNRGLWETLRRLDWTRPRRSLLVLAASPVTRGVGQAPLALVLAPFALFPEGIPGPAAVTGEFLGVIGASAAVFLAVALVRPLRIIGEADRYLLYGAVLPGAAVLGLAVVAGDEARVWVTAAVLAVFGALVIALEHAVAAGEEPGGDGDRREAYRALERSGLERVLCVPANFSRLVTFETGVESVMWVGNAPAEAFGEFDRLFAVHPYPSTDLERLRERYGFDGLVVYERHIDEEYLRRHDLELSYDFSGWTLVHRSGGVRVYRHGSDRREEA